jgi:hypothetical protein
MGCGCADGYVNVMELGYRGWLQHAESERARSNGSGDTLYFLALAHLGIGACSPLSRGRVLSENRYPLFRNMRLRPVINCRDQAVD